MEIEFINSEYSNNKAYLFNTLEENKYVLLNPNNGKGFKNFLLYYDENSNTIHLKDSDNLSCTSAMNSINFIAVRLMKCGIFKNVEKIVFYFKDNDSKIKNRIFYIKNMELTNKEENNTYEEFTKIIY